MINLDISPILLSLGPFQIRYYGLVYVLGFLLALFILFKAKKKGRIDLDKDQIYNLIFYIILGVIIGARAFHIIFWNLSYYISNPIEMLYIWQGGLSFHGGVIGSLIATHLFTRKNKISLMRLADILVIPAIFVLALGRVANFINQEILGTISQVPWCVKFLNSIDPYNCRHPVQLYAAAGRLTAFFILLRFPKPKKDGFIFWNFVFLLGLGRVFLDFIREDIRYLGLSMGQYLSILMVIIGGYVIFKYYKEDLRSLFKFSKKTSS
ncbi:MAG: prolipoprotein diacylglyceryl transferase [Candidatus Woesearchaeota archaeon]